MGKSGARRRKTGAAAATLDADPKAPPPVPELDSSVFLRRAQELKEEGNSKFQAKDYAAALERYNLGLKLLPRAHPDRAVFHSNRAACFLQMSPVDHAAVAAECSLALESQPRFPRALLRRARALEALGRRGEALKDLEALLAADPSHREAADLERRLRGAEVPARSRPSPAALGASAVRGAPAGGLGPCLPARPPPKKTASPPPPPRPEEKPKTQVTPENSVPAPPGEELKLPAPTAAPASSPPASRPLKLIYGHDIRLAEMPENCKFKDLREIVAKRFPSSKAVLVKFQDSDGDLVTITSSSELNLAVASLSPSQTLRLHVVEVDPAQEPPIPEEPDEPEEPKEKIEQKEQLDQDQKEGKEEKEEKQESNEVEIDDWLFEFAQLFRTQVGIDPDAHLDLHELGMELCSEALEETVTSEEAQELFEMAAEKFKEVAALAFFNWGNVHMCAARKRVPLEDAAEKLQSVSEKYALAGEKYLESLRIKPDFYEGLLALGQQHFEMAKLQWSVALAGKTLTGWDPAPTMALFDSAEEKMREASAMWERVETERAEAAAACRRRSRKEVVEEVNSEEAAVMRSQIHLFWGNMLFERSQVEFKLGEGDWKGRLDAAVERFKLAGASEEDIAVVLKNHFSNVKEGGEALTIVAEEKKLT